MKYPRSGITAVKVSCALLLFVAAQCCSLNAQTTVSSLDDDPITSPNDTYNNNRAWAFNTGPDIGCNSTGCHVAGSITTTGSPSNDGSSIQFNLSNSDGCVTQCWSDVFNFNRIYHDGTADNATSFTLDLYNTTSANNVSQALEYTIEQDVLTAPNTYTKFVFSIQCDFVDGIWQVWDGNINGGGAGWVNPNGANIPCSGFDPPDEFAHFVFHFQRPDLSHIYYSDFTVDATNRSVNYTAGVQVVGDWEENLITALQLDGDYAGDSYSAIADQWTVVYF